MTLQDEINELIEARECKNSRIFQQFFVKPFHEKLNKLGKSYDCLTLEELATLKGKAEGYGFLIKIMKSIDEDIKNKQAELKSDEE